MFSKKITDTDKFLDLPMSAQCLYFHLNMGADDEGFIANPKTIRRMIGASEDDLKLLFAKEFLIPFESGVVVIKDWRIHNYIRSDRFSPTVHSDEKKQISVNDNKQYIVTPEEPHNDNDNKDGIPNVIPDGYQMDPQVRLGKDRLGKDRDSGGSTKHSNYIRQANEFYQNNIGAIAPTTAEDLEYWIDDFEEKGATEQEADELVCYAIKEAVDNNARNWKYIKRILNRYMSDNLYTVDMVKAKENERMNGNRNSNQPQKHEKQLDWE
jgi:DnaD/phage-associated family protein